MGFDIVKETMNQKKPRMLEKTFQKLFMGWIALLTLSCLLPTELKRKNKQV